LQFEPLGDRMRARLEPDFELCPLFAEGDRAGFLAREGASFEVAITGGHIGVPAEVAAALPNLKVISSFGVGYDGIDAAGMAARGVIVTHTPDVLNDEVADTAILLWLAVTRRLIPADRWARSGAWAEKGMFPLTPTAERRRVGILGLGRIGQTIAERAKAFNATILYHTRTPKDVDYEYRGSAVALAQDSDVLFVITPGGAGTRKLVSAEVIDALGPEGILVNIARGSVVDEAALVAALQAGRLGGAGLDVFENEPVIPDALKTMENVVLAPHIGSASVETRQAMADLTCDNLTQWAKDGTVLTPVPECRHLAER